MISLATKEQAIDALSDRDIKFGDAAKIYLVSVDDSNMLFTIAEINDKSVEVHLCCKKEHIKMCRVMANEVVKFVKFLGYDTIYTSASGEYKTAQNMAKKLGFEDIGNNIYRLEV